MEDVVITFERGTGPDMSCMEASLTDISQVSDKYLMIDDSTEFSGTEEMDRIQVGDVDSSLVG